MENRREKIIGGYNKLTETYGTVTIKELDPLITNLACLEGIQNNADFLQQQEIAKSYGEIAFELFSPEFDQGSVDALGASIMVNLQWDGMFDFLEGYFAKIGIKISDNEIEHESFSSSYHVRFENNIETQSSRVSRLVSMSFKNNKEELLIEISNPNDKAMMSGLSPKKAFLVSKENNEFFYRGADPDYHFKIKFDDFESVEMVTLILNKGNVIVSIVYHEN